MVSIHAPARGATMTSWMSGLGSPFVSIHAPARGATKGSYFIRKGTRFRFNPRTREGCDVYGYFNDIRITVSIHAPARGATAPLPA